MTIGQWGLLVVAMLFGLVGLFVASRAATDLPYAGGLGLFGLCALLVFGIIRIALPPH